MLLYLVSRIVSATGAFLYPTYASYKTLSRRPASEADLERWLMYWSVLGTLLAVEYTAEWTVSWIPFYYPLKTLFLLYLALPQTRGASYIYSTQLQPRLAAHEAEIDDAIVRARDAGLKWAQRRARAIWAHFTNDSGGGVEGATTSAGVEGVEGVRGAAAMAPPPTLSDPVSGPASIAYGLWRTYAPAITALLQAPPTPPLRSQPHSPSSDPPSPQGPAYAHTSALDDSHSILARRRALEAELAALPQTDSPPPAFPIPRPSSSMYLPAQGDERGRYEEIARDEVEGRTSSSGEDEMGGQGGRPSSQRRSSWWWGRSDGYERVKTD